MLTRAVNRGARRPLVIADLPFGSYQVSDEQALETAIRFVKEGSADAVKLEGAGRDALARPRAHRRGHPGDGPHRPDAADRDDARRLQGAGPHGREGGRSSTRTRSRCEAAGCFSIVLEAVPAPVAARITRGARRSRRSGSAPAPACDGQVLVWHDLLGLYDGHAPRFVKQYAELAPTIARRGRALRRRGARRRVPRGEAHVRDDRRGARAVRGGARGGRASGSRCSTSASADAARRARRARGRRERARPRPAVHRAHADHEQHDRPARRTRAEQVEDAAAAAGVAAAGAEPVARRTARASPARGRARARSGRTRRRAHGARGGSSPASPAPSRRGEGTTPNTKNENKP